MTFFWLAAAIICMKLGSMGMHRFGALLTAKGNFPSAISALCTALINSVLPFTLLCALLAYDGQEQTAFYALLFGGLLLAIVNLGVCAFVKPFAIEAKTQVTAPLFLLLTVIVLLIAGAKTMLGGENQVLTQIQGIVFLLLFFAELIIQSFLSISGQKKESPKGGWPFIPAFLLFAAACTILAGGCTVLVQSLNELQALTGFAPAFWGLLPLGFAFVLFYAKDVWAELKSGSGKTMAAAIAPASLFLNAGLAAAAFFGSPVLTQKIMLLLAATLPALLLLVFSGLFLKRMGRGIGLLLVVYTIVLIILGGL